MTSATAVLLIAAGGVTMILLVCAAAWLFDKWGLP